MKRSFTLLGLLSLVFAVLYFSADLVAQQLPYRFHFAQPQWPFLPQWAPIYLSLNLLLVLVFLVLEEDDRARLFGSLLLETALAWLFFVSLPIEPPRLPYQPESGWFHLADAVNLDYNCFPSLHVAYATSCFWYHRRAWTAVWAAGIAISTLATYQHTWPDLLGGLVLAWLVCGAVKQKLAVTAFVIDELVRVSLRHRRYALISLALVGVSIFRPRTGAAASVGFAYLQRIDDLLDGHLKPDSASQEPEKVAIDQIEQWRSGQHRTDRLGRLAWSLRRHLPGEELKVVAIIEEMRLDRVRVRDGLVLDQEALWRHLDTTFELSLDLMLSASGCHLRSPDVPTLPRLLGWCSIVRDLEDDLALGLVNLPREVLESGAIEDWFNDERRRAEERFTQVASELERVRGRSGWFLLWLFHRSVSKYLNSHDSHHLACLVGRAHA